MELNEFRDEILNEVEVSSRVDKNFNRSVFVDIVMNELREAEEISEFTPCFYDRFYGPRNKKVEIDGYDFDEFDGTFSIVACAYNGLPEPGVKLTQTDISDLAERARRFIEGSLDNEIQDYIEESEPAHELATYIDSIRGNIERFKIFILSDLEKSDRIKSLEVKDIRGVNVDVSLWDISNFYDLQVSKNGFEAIKIDLSKFGFDGIPCLCTTESSESSKYDSYLCAIPGQLLSNLYEKYGSRLMESNVRSFLKLSTKTNKSIRGTILKEPEMFFAYNNGITTTVSEIDIEQHGSSQIIKGFTDLQIVNGGQTTVTLYTVGKSKDKPDLSKIYVPMKISVIDRSNAEQIVPMISRSANTQNKVSEADFFSNSPFHKAMEDQSRRQRTPQQAGKAYSTHWYYERTRGQYQQEINCRTVAEANKFKLENPKNQMFTKTDLAKFRLSYEMKPHVVSKGAQYALLDFAKTVDEEHMERYNDLYFKDTVALAILFRRVQSMVSEQPWYNGGYRAQIVTYSIARLSLLAESVGGKLDLSRIWNEQALSEELERQLIEIMAVVNESITTDNEEGNVAQWCKKTACWAKVKETVVEEDVSFKHCLITASKQNYNRRIASRDERQHNQMNARIDVINRGPEYWRRVYEWGLEHGDLSKTDRSLISTAINMERKMPTEKQCVAIVKILEKLREGGFSE